MKESRTTGGHRQANDLRTSRARNSGSQPPPKILFINRFFYPDQSATSQLLTDLAYRLVEQGHDVHIIASGSADELPQVRNRRSGALTVHRVRTVLAGNHPSMLGRLIQYASFYPSAFSKLLKLARPGDVLVAKTDPPLISVAAMIAARAKRATLINWIQDLYPEVAAELETPFLRGFLGRALMRLRNRALRFAEADVVLGSRMAERLIRLGVGPEKVIIIPNWVDETSVLSVAPVKSVSRSMWGFSSKDFVVGYSGNLGRAHDIDTLVGAAKALRDRSDIKFLFVGGGHQHDRLRGLVSADKLDNFRFEPHQPLEQLGDSLAAADVHWVSLKPNLEGLIVPSKLYGILAAGRSVLSIGDEDGEIARVVKRQNCGIVIRTGDSDGLAAAILRLADDRLLGDLLGRRAREASETLFPRRAALAAWSNVVSAALAKPQRG